ncbi:hypothetical protein SUGI_1178000 [Cryptomeria japonica]|nr:hypothetical protein SUGI_1178000 [Cryptomeria japonica]
MTEGEEMEQPLKTPPRDAIPNREIEDRAKRGHASLLSFACNSKENYTFDRVVNWRCGQKILGSSQASSDSMQVPTFTRVLQGQEARTLGSGDNDAENTHSSMMWRSKLEDQQTI